MELRSVTVRSVFESLNRVSDDTMQWITTGRSGFGGEVWVARGKPDNRKTQAFYVGYLLKKFKMDDITTAVQTTWQLGGKGGKAVKPELKYHQDTQLLIALASPEQLNSAAEVLSQLKLAVEPVIEGKSRDTKKTD